MQSMVTTFDVCIRGAGIVGKALALLLARNRLRVALVGNNSTSTEVADVRAYALNGASKNLLESLRCWPESIHTTAVMEIKVRSSKSGNLVFNPLRQEQTQALAWIADVPHLSTLLTDAVQYQSNIDWVQEPQAAHLTVICEGRDSMSRKSLGIRYDVRTYPESAIATRVQCTLPHHQTASQWFDNSSVLALLPLNGATGKTVAVVWSVEQEKAQYLKDISAAEFALRLEEASGGVLGQLEVCTDRHVWPLQLATATDWCGSVRGQGTMQNPASWVLAGDAAHTVHPLAGQGLNLGLADAQALARHIQHKAYWRGIGDLSILRAYERERKSNLWPMALFTDGLRHLFARTEPPIQTIRNWGMNGLDQMTPMKDWLMRQAAGKSF